MAPNEYEIIQTKTPYRLKAYWLETCNCDPGCNCNFGGFPDHGSCEAIPSPAAWAYRAFHEEVDAATGRPGADLHRQVRRAIRHGREQRTPEDC